MPAYRISLGFRAENQPKLAIFVWIFMCAKTFTERLKPKFVKIANGTTWYRDIVRLSLKPTQSFKPRNVKKKKQNKKKQKKLCFRFPLNLTWTHEG